MVVENLLTGIIRVTLQAILIPNWVGLRGWLGIVSASKFPKVARTKHHCVSTPTDSLPRMAIDAMHTLHGVGTC